MIEQNIITLRAMSRYFGVWEPEEIGLDDGSEKLERGKNRIKSDRLAD
jgi:hypothetical protein